MVTDAQLVQLPNGQVVKVKIDEFDLFVRGGMQYRVNTEEWIDVPGGYAHPCELLGEP